MIAQPRQITENEHLRATLDWTVFSLGVLSLTIAITATIVTHSVNAQSQPAQQTVITTG